MKALKKKKLTQKRLKEVLNYNPVTGVWRRLKALSNSVKNIKIVGGICKTHGYRRMSIDGVRYRSNRLAWMYMEGYFPEHVVDHKDKIRHNDKWDNLRAITQQCNMKNCKISVASKTDITGVNIHKNGKFFTYININGTKKHLGYFAKLGEAAMARWQAEKKYNWPNCQTTSTSYLYLKESGLV